MIRVLQLIDSLEAGGSERLSISLANSLVGEVNVSFLCVTRAEGVLKATIDSSIGYLFLEKKSSLDVKAILRLIRFVKENKINIIHAHSTSFFTATLVKLVIPEIKLIWHDHYGGSEFLDKRPKKAIKACSRFFNHIFCVNEHLLNWATQNLHGKSASYLQNFVSLKTENAITELHGSDGKRILSLANLRPQKDHLNLLKAFNKINKEHPDWTLHFVGRDYDDDYSKTMKNYVESNELNSHVFFYGTCSDIGYILKQAEIGVLSSKSEGLPISLLEYGFGKLSVLATDVGDCGKVIDNGKNGLLVEAMNDEVLKEGLSELISDYKLRKSSAEKLHNDIMNKFSKDAVIKIVLSQYKKLLN